MSRQRTRSYQVRIDQALATPRLQDTLHRFADAYLLSRENAFAGIDFEALRTGIAAMKDEVREHREEYLAQFTRNAEAAGATVYLARTADGGQRLHRRPGQGARGQAGGQEQEHGQRGDPSQPRPGRGRDQGAGDRSRRVDHPVGRAAPQPHGHAGDPHAQGRGRRAVRQGYRQSRAGRDPAPGATGPRAAAPGVPGCRHGDLRGQPRRGRNRRHRPGHQRGERPAGHHPAEDPRGPGRHRKAGADPGGCPQGHRRAAEERHRPADHLLCHLDSRRGALRR